VETRPLEPEGSEIEFQPTEEVLRDELKVHRQPDHGCCQTLQLALGGLLPESAPRQGCQLNHKLVGRSYKELQLNLRVKPRKPLV
jgi:hypothetical protein